MATMTKTVEGALAPPTRLEVLGISDLASAFLRLAMGAGLLSAVADRLGIWGPPGTVMVSWGNFHNFLLYTAKLSPWCPAACIPPLGVLVTIAEAGLGILLVVGFFTQVSALLAAIMTLGFGLAMTFVLGVHAPMNYSVFVFSAGSFLIASRAPDRFSLDKIFRLKWVVKNS